ncbi:NnrS family protein [Shewanella fidelis]|uniref:NnrS family protein n=1 Tax=Shewanella fidelis TaxID=173509 RepID=A0AAW8NQV9_9GAMM|nr:NnrS family protein [Shewanella fidelis]MDR8524591.1 NnrS family protein [Shewanella fidelis]MDW4812066.1 NnrS family protein [Shewanella fidelis]MDW4817479.1 NnrS family protein [Shewanella fidelis]MDW4821546.1 NnrS family protein [Shewanella fidelis]MDW4822673.1 NnrS family protein [Shewanella fidelis]
MLNIDDPKETEKIPAIFRLGFRPFFLGGAAVAMLFVPLWLLTWFYPQYSLFQTDFWVKVVPLWWHPHEMLFGFALAIVCGFLLTSVQTWTNQPGMKGWVLAMTFACWLLARLTLLLPVSIPLWLPAILDSLFLSFTAIKLWRCIYKVKQWHNIGFPIMLFVAMSINLLSYYALSQRDFSLSQQIWQAMLWWLGLLITIVGGRVIPFFTAIRIKQTKPNPIPVLDKSLIAIMVLLVAQAIAQFMPTLLEQILLFAAAVLHFVRWSRWFPHKTLAEPMLWSLQLSYLLLPITLFLLAWNIHDEMAYRHLLHLFAIGTLAGICLSMISRVSLGHTSRNIYQGPNMIIAFACLPIAAILRAVMPIWVPELYQTWLWLAGGLWSLAFAMFVINYAAILSKPRVDGRPG